MDIFFATSKLQELCSKATLQRRHLGPKCAKKLQRRLSDLQAVQHVGQLVAGRPHPLNGDRAGEFSLTLDGGIRLVFAPTSDPPPERPDGGTDWDRVTRITITYIGDYHD